MSFICTWAPESCLPGDFLESPCCCHSSVSPSSLDSFLWTDICRAATLWKKRWLGLGATKTTRTSSSLVTLTAWRGKWRNKQMSTFWANERTERGHLSLVSLTIRLLPLLLGAEAEAKPADLFRGGATARSCLPSQPSPGSPFFAFFLLRLVSLSPLSVLWTSFSFFSPGSLRAFTGSSPSPHPLSFMPQDILTQIWETYIRYNDVISCLSTASVVSWACLRVLPSSNTLVWGVGGLRSGEIQRD